MLNMRASEVENSSVSATFGSDVCSIFTFVRPSSFFHDARTSSEGMLRCESQELTFDAPLMKPMQISCERPNMPAGTPL